VEPGHGPVGDDDDGQRGGQHRGVHQGHGPSRQASDAAGDGGRPHRPDPRRRPGPRLRRRDGGLRQAHVRHELHRAAVQDRRAVAVGRRGLHRRVPRSQLPVVHRVLQPKWRRCGREDVHQDRDQRGRRAGVLQRQDDWLERVDGDRRAGQASVRLQEREAELHARDPGADAEQGGRRAARVFDVGRRRRQVHGEEPDRCDNHEVRPAIGNVNTARMPINFMKSR
jgi:hypothetical protein